jgi:hypothetical protein
MPAMANCRSMVTLARPHGPGSIGVSTVWVGPASRRSETRLNRRDAGPTLSINLHDYLRLIILVARPSE